MSNHRFATGQMVRLINMTGRSPAAANIYRVVTALPARATGPQYRLRNEEFDQERIVMERDLELI